MNGIEVGEGKYGKKYFNLIETFKSYYESGLGKAYDYEKTFSYLEKINPYWIKLVEQFIPATTIQETSDINLLARLLIKKFVIGQIYICAFQKMEQKKGHLIKKILTLVNEEL
jgi:hypothetical protein